MPSKQQLANAQKLVDEGNVVKQSKNSWHVLSSTVYEVTRTADGFVCEKLDQDDTKELCQGWKNCQGKVEDKTCKHCEAVRLTLKNVNILTNLENVLHFKTVMEYGVKNIKYAFALIIIVN